MKLSAVLIILFLCISKVAFAGSVGFQQFKLASDTSRPLKVSL